MTRKTDPTSIAPRCTHCLTEFRPLEGGRCGGCGRPLCRVHGGGRDSTACCPRCARAAQAASGRGRGDLARAA